MKSLAECRLYTFVDTAFLKGRDPIQVAGQLCSGGADLIQLRSKDQSPENIRRIAERIQPVMRAAGVWFVLNDHLEIAAATKADLCHLGQEDFLGAGYLNVETLRATFPKLKIGLSTHAPEQAQRAVEAGADYIAIGPVFATGTKPTATPTSLEYVRWAAASISIPWFAIGGINLNNLDSVLAAGARRICVVSAILNAPDIADACREFKARLKGSGF